MWPVRSLMHLVVLVIPDNRAHTPSHDQLGDIFATLDAPIFQRCFVAWVASITGVSADVIAIDGDVVDDPDDSVAIKARALSQLMCGIARQAAFGLDDDLGL